MYCPHCNANLTYRERSWRTCSGCRREFALEPKTIGFQGNALALHDILFRKIIDQMSQGGQFSYTADQLRHRAARKVASEQDAARSIGDFFSLLIHVVVVSLILGTLYIAGSETESILPIAVCGTPVGLFLIGWSFYKFISPFRYSIPMDLNKFHKNVIERWKHIYGSRPQGLIDQQVLDRHPEHHPPPGQVQAVVACPVPDVLLCLRANGVPERLNVQLIPTREPFTATQQATVERLRAQPDLPLLLLHDASPQGCLLPYTIRKSLRLLAYHNVVDVGLHPSDAIEHKLLRLGASPSQRALTYLKKRVDQGGQKQTRGAGGGSARPLSQEEFKWLEKGYYAPLLFIPPARLIKVLVRTLQRLNLATPATMNMNMNMSVSKAALPADPEERAQVEAQAVGFMSWPTV